MQSGLSSALDDNFITAVDQYCMGESSSHKLFWSEAAQQATVLQYKIYFMRHNNYIKQLPKCVGTARSIRLCNRDISFMFLGNDNKHYYLGRETGFHNSSLECLQMTGTDDWQRWALITCDLMESAEHAKGLRARIGDLESTSI